MKKIIKIILFCIVPEVLSAQTGLAGDEYTTKPMPLLTGLQWAIIIYFIYKGYDNYDNSKKE